MLRAHSKDEDGIEKYANDLKVIQAIVDFHIDLPSLHQVSPHNPFFTRICMSSFAQIRFKGS
eukprot:CAMPEP_0204634596 /NCGR_PEP_ID=MMETSP0717-20131115/29633_1 /ASSEMBLY_ACC=CAM_ASM_000666 /TAXON_ID=230516 /ORGANISM="Chaetoceros curvisetus" /LENGTH=61 /DNA_ID=CAMNT_0051653085 /DNA_START=76 /DNA_END=258 /DNA_ORIENTATION=-